MSAVRIENRGRIATHIRRLSSFSVIGAIVTLLSTTSNVVLLAFFHTPLILTYVCVYCTAITLSYVLNSRFTFASPLTARKLLLYFGVYLSSMGLGVVLLTIYRALLPFENWVLPLLVLPFTALFNYSLSSMLMLRRRV
jgi:putative flippase GtrA